MIDVHLMIERPSARSPSSRRPGADTITFHAEATPHVDYALKRIREAGCRAGVAINPATPAEVLTEVADLSTSSLCMTVNPGWGGQPFIERSLDKLARLRDALGAGHARSRSTAASTRQTAAPCARGRSDAVRRRLGDLRRSGPGAAYAAIAAAAGAV